MTTADHLRNIARDGILSPRHYGHAVCPGIYQQLQDNGLIRRAGSNFTKYWHITPAGEALLAKEPSHAHG